MQSEAPPPPSPDHFSTVPYLDPDLHSTKRQLSEYPKVDAHLKHSDPHVHAVVQLVGTATVP